MKKIILSSFAILISILNYAETTKEVPTEIKSVTIYQQGALITREGTILIPKGKSTLVFQGLPAKITPSSIQISSTNNVLIVSVTHNIDYLNKSITDIELTSLYKKQRALNDSIKVINNLKTVYSQEKTMILSNSSIAGDNGVDIDDLQKAAEFFRKRLTEIETTTHKLDNDIYDLKNELYNVSKQLLELNYGGAVAQKNSDIANLRNSLSTMLVVPPCENQRASLQVLKTKRLDAELVGKSAERSRNDLSTRKANINNELVLLRLKHKEESLIEFIPKETCQLCGSPTPQMQIEELRATFNTTKSESLERISANGKTLNSRFAEASSDFEKAILDMKESDKTVIDLDIEIKGLEIKITDLTDISAVSLTPTYLAINKQIQDISSEIAEIKNGGENARNEIYTRTN